MGLLIYKAMNFGSLLPVLDKVENSTSSGSLLRANPRDATEKKQSWETLRVEKKRFPPVGIGWGRRGLGATEEEQIQGESSNWATQVTITAM